MHPDWRFPDGVTYLNHGSFGPSPLPVAAARDEWLRRLNANPMDFYLRQLGDCLDVALQQLAEFLDCSPARLAFVANATTGMNVAANSIPLAAGDEVLLTDHEYGAVVRIWGQRCAAVKARTVLAKLPLPLDSAGETVDAIFQQVTEKTRVLVVSHVTSPTGVILPVQQICERAQARGIVSVVDGPHAIGMLDFRLRDIPCDYYAASCHKWLSAPLGSGFLYVRPGIKPAPQALVTSWGRNFQGRPTDWRDEFHWPGTFDPTPWLTISAAIEYLNKFGRQRFQNESFSLAAYSRQKLAAFSVPRDTPIVKPGREPDWTGSMAVSPLNLPPADSQPGTTHPLQKWLWEEKRTEIPVISWRDRTLLRTSSHIYNTREEIDQLALDVAEWMKLADR